MHSVEASILVEAPVDFCYQTWADFERLPLFMSRVVRVCRASELGQVPAGHQEGEVWHWEVRGPLGRIYDWDAVIVMQEPNKVISWAPVVPEAYEFDEVATSGSVNFLKESDLLTLVQVKLTYSAPLAPLGELVVDVLQGPDTWIDEALHEFKVHVEKEYAKQSATPVPHHSQFDAVIDNEQQLIDRLGMGPARANIKP